MTISINPSTYVITVPQADLTPLGGTNYQHDTSAFRIALKDWEDSEAGIYQPKTHNHNTVVTIGGIQYARLIEILAPYTITYQDVGSPYRVFLAGSNNNILERTNLNNVSVAPNNSAGLVNVAEVQYSVFGDGVTIDVANGTAGTVYPKGSMIAPVNNLPDALAIAVGRGFKTFYVKGNLTPSLSDNIAGYSFWGEDKSSTTLTLPAGTPTGISTIGTKMHGLTLVGTCRGRMDVYDCNVRDVIGLCASGGNANIIRCVLSGNVQLNSVADQKYAFEDCSGAEGLVLDVNGCPASIHFTDFSGEIEVKNVTNASQHFDMDIDSGAISLHSSITQPQIIHLRGIAKITGSLGAENRRLIDTSGLLKPVSAQYGGRVYLSSAGTAGHEYPNGLFDSMINNFADGVMCALDHECNDFHLHSDMTLLTGTSLDYYRITGHTGYLLTVQSGAVTNNLKFEGIKITGVMNGPNEFFGNHLIAVSALEGTLENCTGEGSITLKNGGMAHISGFRSHTQTPVEFHVGTAMMGATNVFGVFTIADKSGAEVCNLRGVDGNVTVNNTCTAGTIYLTGIGYVTNNGGAGCTVICNGRVIPNNGVTYAMERVEANITHVIGDPVMVGSTKDTGWGGTP